MLDYKFQIVFSMMTMGMIISVAYYFFSKLDSEKSSKNRDLCMFIVLLISVGLSFPTMYFRFQKEDCTIKSIDPEEEVTCNTCVPVVEDNETCLKNILKVKI